MEILRCEKLSKIYGSGQTRVTALDGIDLSVNVGEFVAIIGASGSGKSTLLHMLGGVDQPSSGRVLVEDTDISNLSEKQRAIFRRRKVGLVYQFYNLIPSIDVRQNILLPMLLDNQKPDEGRFTELVGILGRGDRLTHLPNQLSGGQQQRVATARALIYRPAILLADEPKGNLDKKNSEEILGLLKLSGKKYKQTILLITHDEKIALEADRIITIEDGRILSDKGVGK
ncbi:MAG: ABC transporter ATP-binding protein [Lachnospiraceae bacterium]|nr:ABC transporter ATP-binding protein [Lachnospiraceae bacterium]